MNRLLLGRNNNRKLEGVIELPQGSGCTKLLKQKQEIQEAWYRIFLEEIHHLIPRQNKWLKTDPIHVDDICLFIYNSSNSGTTWRTGRVTEIIDPTKVQIQYCSSKTQGEHGLFRLSKVTRNPRELSVIIGIDELDLNSHEYYDRIIIPQVRHYKTSPPSIEEITGQATAQPPTSSGQDKQNGQQNA